MKRLLILATMLLTLVLVGAACSSDSNDNGGGTPDADNGTGDITAIAGNSDLAVGPNRLAFALTDNEDQNRPIVQSADTSVHVRLYAGDALQSEADAGFTWAIDDVIGFWTADVSFDQAGEWRLDATLTRGDKESTVSLPLLVQQVSAIPNVGDRAPATDNLTFASEPNTKRVTTDPEPDASFYEMTVTEALDAGKPFVVIFATPAFCQTRFCGPMLDNVKEASKQFAGQVNFIHIEPYDLDENGALVTDAQNFPVPAQPSVDWRLQTEPWVFIVGADGVITKRIEGAASVAELSQSIEDAIG